MSNRGGSVIQSGLISPGNFASWATDGVLEDSGVPIAGSPPIAPLGGIGTGGGIVQSGEITPTHAALWTVDGVIQDAGGALNGDLSELGIVNDGNIALGIQSAASPSAFEQFGVSVASDGTVIISANAIGGGPGTQLYFEIDGVLYPFNGSGFGAGAWLAPLGALSTPGFLVQTGATGGSPSLMNWDRQRSTQNEVPVLSGAYTINDEGALLDGWVFYKQIDLVDTIANKIDGGGIYTGPRASSITLNVGVTSSASLNAGYNGDRGIGSDHIALWSDAIRNLDPSYTPTTTNPYAQLWGQIWNLLDRTNLPSSLGASILNELDCNANNLDDETTRQGLVMVIGNQNTPGPGVPPVEWAYGHSFFGPIGVADATHQGRGTMKAIYQAASNYNVAALDMTACQAASTTVASASSGTTLNVNSVLPFTTHAAYYGPPTPGGPIPILVNGNPYNCTGFALTGPAAVGTLTLSAALTGSDGAAGNSVVNQMARGIFLPEGGLTSGIAWEFTGGHTTYYDPVASVVYSTGGTYVIGTAHSGMALAPQSIQMVGDAANIAMYIATKGTGAFSFQSGPNPNFQIYPNGMATANWVVVTAGDTGQAAEIFAFGTDATSNLNIYANGGGQISLVSNTQFQSHVGFNYATPIAKPTVTGAKGGNAALASLMTALAAYGLVTDSTS